MKVYSLYILNKAGGLIYQNDLSPGLSILSANDYLVLAGTLHGAHAIATRLQPLEIKTVGNELNAINTSILATGKSHCPNSNRLGLQSIDTDQFSLYVFQTLTGLKFVIITKPAGTTPDQGHNQGEASRQFEKVQELFKQYYIVYTDYVMKDPFYSLDMPIKSPMFEQKIVALSAGS